MPPGCHGPADPAVPHDKPKRSGERVEVVWRRYEVWPSASLDAREASVKLSVPTQRGRAGYDCFAECRTGARGSADGPVQAR
jgi:hypothetical protein